MRILITSPSLDEQENVSGISTMISSIVESGVAQFEHFRAGRKDGEMFDAGWLMTQIKLPFEFRSAISRVNPDVVHINTSFEPRAIVRDLILAKFAGSRPIVLHIHGGRFVMQAFTNPTLAWAAEQLMRAAKRIVVLSDAERDSLHARVSLDNIVVLPNAVPTERFRSNEQSRDAKKSIVYMGRLDESKGLSDMVAACRMLLEQGFKFDFACYGAGPDKQKFLSEMKSVLASDFYYGGVVAGAEKIRAFTSADIFLMPSKFEGLPLALLEAMAAGCVPVVSKRGSIPTVVDDGRNGFLIEPGDLTQIVGKLKFLLSEGERGWEEFRSNARETVRERFDIRAYVGKLGAMYREIATPK